ncbi:MAG: hypothetical protein WC729_23450 [Sphingomonas sp.]|jgi:hypothetical protein|uniref:DUF6916 family protein n=1 Tax=Sphingomonas sp. TaxID=28214 RepID=UPI0035616AFD
MTDVAIDRKELEDFEPHVGTTFSIVAEGLPPLPMLLEEIKALKHNSQDLRAPFDLIFRGNDELLPQGLYQFRHDAIGDVAIFIVPVAKGADGVRYCATFN